MKDLEVLERIAWGKNDIMPLSGPADLIQNADLVFGGYVGGIPRNNFELWEVPEAYPLFLVWVSMTEAKQMAWNVVNHMMHPHGYNGITPFDLSGNVWNRYCQVVLAHERKYGDEKEPEYFTPPPRNLGLQAILVHTQSYRNNLEFINDSQLRQVEKLCQQAEEFCRKKGWVA